MKIKITFLTTFILALTFCAQAQLSFKNSTNKPISVAITFYGTSN